MNPETGEAAQRTCGGCRFFNLDTCMNVSNKRDGIRPEVDADASCHHFKEKMEGATWQVVNGDWRYGKWRPEEKGEIDPRLRTCGNCKRRNMGFCTSNVFSPAVIDHNGKVVKPYALVKNREYHDKDDSACALFVPITHPQLTYWPWSPPNTRQMVKIVRCCGECGFYLNGICMNVKWQRVLGLKDRPKVEYFAKACKMSLSVLEELK